MLASMRRRPILMGICLIAGTVLLFAFVALFMVDSRRYSALADQAVIRQARQGGWGVTIGDSSLHFFKYTLHNLSILPPRSLVGFEVDELTVHPSLLSLMAKRLSAGIDAHLYGGQAHVDFDLAIADGGGSITGKASNIDLNAHPAIDGLGVKKGTLGIEFDNVGFAQGEPKSGAVAVHLSNVDKPDSTVFPGALMGLPLTVPAFADLSLDISCQLSGSDHIACAVQSSSSLGTLSGPLEIGISNRKVNSLNSTLEVQLRDQGYAAFGKELELLSGTDPSLGARHFELRVNGNPAMPNFKIRRL